MRFEYDVRKNAANKEKHRINFEEAQALWKDDFLFQFPANSSTEARFCVVGKIGRRYWLAVATSRAESIRIISVRTARKEEREAYEEQKKNYSRGV
jgi:uncharacterized DUF497 family protein